MADATVGLPAPRKRRGWLRAIAWVVGILIVLVVVLYFVATSSAFFKGVILRRVSKALNAQVTVSDASISPFSRVVLHNLKVQTTGTEPLVSANEVRLRYSLWDIIHGNIHVDEVALVSPTITLIQNPDGSTDLDPILKAQKTEAQKTASPAKAPSAKPPQIDLKKFALTDATLRFVKNYTNGTHDVAELSHLTVTLDNLQNGQTAKLALSTGLGLQTTDAALEGKLGGNFALALTLDLKPASINGSTRLDVTKAEGALADMAAFGSDFNVNVTPTDIKEVALRFQKGNARLGELLVSGPFDLAKTEGRLRIQLTGIDRQLLDLAGASSGMKFGSTTISSTNEVELAKGGEVITAGGQLNINNFQLTRTNQTTPQLNLESDYNVTVDRAQSTALLRALTLNGTQNGSPLLKAELTSPMQIGWGSTNAALGNSALTLAVTSLNLADWKPFLGDVAPAGLVNVTAKVLSQQGGQQMTVDFDSHIDHLTVNAGSNHIADVSIAMQANARAANMQQFDLTTCKLALSRQNHELASASASGTYDKAAQTADMQLAAEAALAPLLQAAPQPNMTISSGSASLTAHLTQKQKTQSVAGNMALADFTGNFGTNQIRSLGTTADFDVGMTPEQVQIRKFSGKLTQGPNTAGNFDLSGTYDPASKIADLQTTAHILLAQLLQAVPQPGMNVTSGTADLKAHVTQKQNAQSVTGNFALADFTGKFGNSEVQNYGVTADLDAAISPQQIELRKASGHLTQGSKPGGNFDLTATYDVAKKSAGLTAKLVDLNQNGVGPFLQPALGDKQLVSVAINANANAQYDPQAASSVKADLQVTNLVVKDPKGEFPATPLEAKMQVDASLQKQVADVRQFQITLTPTARATNQVQLTGQVDMSHTNAYQGHIKLAADSLDVTRYYDLFMGQKKAPETAAVPAPAPATAPAAAPAATNQEPAPIKFPLQNFTAEADVHHFYLHDVDISDFQTTTKIDAGHVVVNPFKLTLNGAPVNSTVDLDLGVPGWKYNVSLNAQAIPLAPLVDSFQPERKGQMGGTLTAQGQINGAGITGASLQKNLAGQFDVNMTNLNLNVINLKSPVLKTLINVVAGIPELLRNPTGTASSLIGGLIGQAGTSGGLAGDLQRSPIDSIIVRGTAGSGQVTLQQATVTSRAFEANATGTVTLATVLTNSTLEIPVTVSLSQSIAQRLSLASAATTTNAAYVKLPDFYTMEGTVGAPKNKINYVALAGTMGKSVTGAIEGLGSNVGGVLGNILGTKSTTNTNQPATNQSPVKNLLKGFLHR